MAGIDSSLTANPCRPPPPPLHIRGPCRGNSSEALLNRTCPGWHSLCSVWCACCVYKACRHIGPEQLPACSAHCKLYMAVHHTHTAPTYLPTSVTQLLHSGPQQQHTHNIQHTIDICMEAKANSSIGKPRGSSYWHLKPDSLAALYVHVNTEAENTYSTRCC